MSIIVEDGRWVSGHLIVFSQCVLFKNFIIEEYFILVQEKSKYTLSGFYVCVYFLLVVVVLNFFWTWVHISQNKSWLLWFQLVCGIMRHVVDFFFVFIKRKLEVGDVIPNDELKEETFSRFYTGFTPFNTAMLSPTPWQCSFHLSKETTIL